MLKSRAELRCWRAVTNSSDQILLIRWHVSYRSYTSGHTSSNSTLSSWAQTSRLTFTVIYRCFSPTDRQKGVRTEQLSRSNRRHTWSTNWVLLLGKLFTSHGFFFSLKQKWIPIVNAFGLFVHSCSKLHRKAKEVRRWAKRRTRTERADGEVNFSRAASPCRSRLPRSLPGSERLCLLPGSLTGVCSPEVWPTCRPHFLPRIKHLQSQLLEYFRNLHCTHGPSQRLSSSELFPAHGCFVCWSAECLAAVSMAVLLHHTGYYVWGSILQ